MANHRKRKTEKGVTESIEDTHAESEQEQPPHKKPKAAFRCHCKQTSNLTHSANKCWTFLAWLDQSYAVEEELTQTKEKLEGVQETVTEQAAKIAALEKERDKAVERACKLKEQNEILFTQMMRRWWKFW